MSPALKCALPPVMSRSSKPRLTTAIAFPAVLSSSFVPSWRGLGDHVAILQSGGEEYVIDVPAVRMETYTMSSGRLAKD